MARRATPRLGAWNARGRAVTSILIVLLGGVWSAAGWGCGSRRPPPSPTTVTPVVRDIPTALRNTIFARSSMNGLEPTLVSGFGLVVGLNGTGGGTLDDRVAGTMERVMGQQGIGRGSRASGALVDPLSGQPKTPRQLLRDPSVAVVLVEAVIPPGSPDGYSFDVFVRALNATSLEGGRLWTTELRVGGAQTFGGYQTRKLAEAGGEIYINPFAEPGREGDGVTRTVGRILDGGVVTSPFGIQLVLDNASPTMARSVVDAINSRFPERAGDRGPTARGRSSQDVEINIPGRYRDNPEEFLQILRFLTVDGRFAPEQYAQQYVRQIRSLPALADELAWALVGLGEPAIPFCRELYDEGELIPKLAGLRAGAMLGDPRAALPLLEIARDAPSTVLRSEAISLVSRLSAGPQVDQALRELARSRELSVRVAAYEARAERAQRAQFNRLLARERERPQGTGAISVASLERHARVHLPEGTIQGVSRRAMGASFLMDRVEGGEPLIYITQQGEPRVVLFGEAPSIETPVFVSAWNDRLWIVAEEAGAERLRVRYRDPRTGRVTVHEVRPSLTELVDFLSRRSSPEDPRPGLGMTYAEVVGVLHAIHQGGATKAEFATERDRLLANLFEASRGAITEERPESASDTEPIFFTPDVAPTLGDLEPGSTLPAQNEPRRLVVPIPPRDPASRR
ncbi:MAG: hypothetical protein EA378_02800 [Phycisphaerales bacterium]|nr:MAG: hypothetical protein EA378_02800 [Phycisphaerales bacterium]